MFLFFLTAGNRQKAAVYFILSRMWPLIVLWEAGLLPSLPQMFIFVGILALTLLIMNSLKVNHIHIRDVSKEHNWQPLDSSEKVNHCNICETLLLMSDGVFCDCCGVCADSGCIKLADKNLRCKSIAISYNKSMNHHWVQGNIAAGVICNICNEECSVEPGLVDWQCCWCQRAVHETCKTKLNAICDFGKFQKFIIPPTCVVVAKHGSIHRNFRVTAVKVPCCTDWTPLIVVANQKSGNKDGCHILSMFRRMLNPGQVIDLSEKPADVALEWCSLLKNVSCKILVAGGDGTIGWILNTIEKLNLERPPSVAIMPLGTGNDLSRELGWGSEHDKHTDPNTVLEHIQNAVEQNLDRWRLVICPEKHLGIRLPKKQLFMYNYISFGVDAQVTLDFHKTRESPFYIFSSRLINKMLYLGYGTQQAVERGCRDLQQRIEVYLDGKKADLPSIESIVVLNIPFWGGGVQLWNLAAEIDEDLPRQSICDGRLEVVAIYSSFHIAQLQMQLSQPFVVGQARKVQVKLHSPTPVQVDGEPWMQKPSDVNILFHNQASVLKLAS